MALGPLVGGGLVDLVGWRSIFWLNIPIAVGATVLMARFVPESRAARARRFDPLGQLGMAALLGTLTYAIIEGRGLGWQSPTVLACFAAVFFGVAALVRYELRRPEPLLDPRFFRSRPFSGAVVIAILGFAAMSGFLFLNTLYLQDVRGLSPFRAALMTLPMAGMTAVASPLSGRLVGSRGPRIPLLLSGAGICASAIVLLRLQPSTPYLVLGLAYLVFGFGFGMLNAPVTNAAVAGMPREQAGVAAAVASTSRQVGASLGVAVLGVLSLNRLDGPVRTGLSAASHAGWLAMLGCGAGILALTVAITPRVRAESPA
jgi:predicted MFS family arabinose efflux permease